MGNIVNLSHLLEFYLGGAGVRLYRVPNNWCSQLGGHHHIGVGTVLFGVC